jgi:molecular chaperone DnaK (HSP70)
VTASLLTKIDSTVKLNKLNNKYSVIAVPDYLTHNERKALLDSVNIARESQQESYGYSLVNESTAVGIDYGFYKMN